MFSEKKNFFGTIRQAAESNEHPTCTFLLSYKLLSVYSAIKPPICGNCTVTEENIKFIITIADIKNLLPKTKSKNAKSFQELKTKLDKVIKENNWEVDQIIEIDTALAPIVDCIIYYVTGFSF